MFKILASYFYGKASIPVQTHAKTQHRLHLHRSHFLTHAENKITCEGRYVIVIQEATFPVEKPPWSLLKQQPSHTKARETLRVVIYKVFVEDDCSSCPTDDTLRLIFS